jgi:hypothetical protein
MVQIEDVLQFGSEIAIQVSEKPEDAEERRDDDERHKIVGRV